MTFLDFLRLTRANFLVIFGCVTLGVLAMTAYTLRQPVVYTATSEGYVVVGNASSSGELLTNMSLEQRKAASYTTLISDRRVGERVAAALDVSTPPEAIVGSLSAYAAEDSNLISVSGSADTPQEARDLANAAVFALGEVIDEVETTGLVHLDAREEALMPSTPSSPDYQRNLLFGALAGLLLGYGIALLRRTVDRKVRTVANVEEAGVGAVIGIVPVADPLSRRSRGVREDLGVVAEAFRQLRTNLRFVDVDHPPRSIVVTSANPHEGKSTVSSNLARMMAAAGQPTLLIDADLRKPSLASTFDLDPAVGLTQVLVGDLTVADVLQETRTPNLQVITAGRIPPNPSELLGSQRMHALVDELTKEFMVILDAPPLLPVTDAGLLSVTCDGVLLVIAVGKTAVEEVSLCRKVLDQVGGRLLGGVLNMAPSRGLGAVVYGYGGGSYQQGYGEQTTRRWRGLRAARPAPDRNDQTTDEVLVAGSKKADGTAEATGSGTSASSKAAR